MLNPIVDLAEAGEREWACGPVYHYDDIMNFRDQPGIKLPDPKVSIVIPVHNGSNYLGEAIESALAQTYKNIEIIVVNDGSSDQGKSEAIATSYEDRVRYFFKENSGVASALNVGIQNMEGEWFSWLSHDDRYLPHKIEAQINFWKRNTQARIIGSNCQVIDNRGFVIKEYRNILHPVIRNGRDALETWINGCGLLIHKNCFETVGLFNVANKTTQDIEMWQRMVRNFNIFFTPEVLVQWRKHSESGSETKKREHNLDKAYYVKWIIDNFDISWYFPSDLDLEANNTKHYRSMTYNWMGDHMWSALGTVKGARLCYWKAFQENPWLPFPLLKIVADSVHATRLFVDAKAVLSKYLTQVKGILRSFI